MSIISSIDVISGIFTPFLGILAGTGVMKGLLSLAVFLGWMTTDSGAYQILYAAADAFIYFLPIALAITSARKFKANEFLAAALAMAMLYPGLISGLFMVKSFAFCASIFIIPNMISNIEGVESNVVAGIIAIAVAFVIAFVLQ